MRTIIWLALAGAALVAGPAAASVTVIGNGLGRVCYEAAKFERPTRDSLETCTAALRDEALSARDRAATFVNRGIIQMQAKNLAAAIADYDAALEISPSLAEAMVNKGIALLQRGGSDAAAAALLTRAIEGNPERPAIAYYTRAVANEMLGSARAAFDDYTKAAELAPTWREPAEQLRRFSVVRKASSAG